MRTKKPRPPVQAINPYPPDTDPDAQLAWLCAEIRGRGREGKAFVATKLANLLVAHAERLKAERDALKLREVQGE